MKHPQYNPDLDNPPLTDAELDQLEALLADLPGEAVMDIEGLDGYLTALLLSPELPPADDWLPRVWGGDAETPPPFASGKQTKRVVQLVLRHMAGIHRQLQADVDQFEPFFAVAERDEADDAPAAEVSAAAAAGAAAPDGAEPPAGHDGLWVDAGNWCAGFLCATELQPAQWSPLFDDPEAAELLEPIVLLGADPAALSAPWSAEQQAQRSSLAGRDALSRRVPDIVSALWHQRGEPDLAD